MTTAQLNNTETTQSAQTAAAVTTTQSEAAKVTKHRRTPEERHAEQVAAAKAKADKIAERARQAAEEAKRLMEEAQQQAVNLATVQSTPVITKPRTAKAIPTIPQDKAETFGKEIQAAATKLAADLGLSIADVGFRLTRHGTGLSVSILGCVAGVTAVVKRGAKIAAEAARFTQQHQLLGLKAELLGAKVTLANEEGVYIFKGLKGAGNNVVLQREGSSETIVMRIDDYKTQATAA